MALLAVVLASLSAVSIGGHPRPVLALAAVALLGILVYSKLRAMLSRDKKARPGFDAYERAERIQEERDRRYLR